MRGWRKALVVATAVGVVLLASRTAAAAQATGAGCAKSLRARGGLTGGAPATEAELDALALRFIEHCRSTPQLAADARVRNLDLRWNKHVLLSDFPGDASSVLGSFNRTSGCLYMRYMPDRPLAEQLGILLHELAHSNGSGHDDAWKDAFLFFAGIATQQLGWEVTLKCPTVCRSYQVCSRSNCPYCDWAPSFEACAK